LGNSKVKAGVFNDKQLIYAETLSRVSPHTLNRIIRKFPIKNSALASVINNTSSIESKMRKNFSFIKLNADTRLPFKIKYETPQTLGADRIANLAGAYSLFPKKNVLIISAGTCITYDVLSAKGIYSGGNITPGIDMRLRAMHTFTAKLPLVKKKPVNTLTGNTTQNSILTGAIKGAAFEVDGFISAYKKFYPALKVIITGGDASLLVGEIQSKIFAVPHLVLYGLNEIIHSHNAH